jgi:hypothetical protein
LKRKRECKEGRKKVKKDGQKIDGEREKRRGK